MDPYNTFTTRLTVGDNTMEPRDDKEHEEHRGHDSPPEGEHATRNDDQSSSPQVIGTDDRAITPGPANDPDGISHPDRTMAIETSQIRGPDEAFNPHFVMVPIESDRPPRDRSGAGDGGKRANENGEEKGRKSQGGQDGHAQKDQSNPKEDRNDDQDGSGDRHEEKKRGHSSQTPSLTRILLYSGLVALVCGIAGAWGYSYFFGSTKSGDQKSSGRDSNSGKDSDSNKKSDSSKSSDSSKKDTDSGKLLQAQAAWMDAVKELRQARAAEQAARSSEEETKAVLDFFKRTLLSAGRPGDVSLAEAFWAGGQGKDVTLRKAVDVTESQVAEAFADRPLGEASVREMLGLAYLSLGDTAQAVKEYERAFALREAMQGANHPDTAACRNQLAVVYRLAGRPAEGGRLFDRNPNSPAHAAALAVRGSTLLVEKKPAEAELELRECLTIRQKIQPDDWTTFETKSMLGEALLDQKKFIEAEPLLLSGYEGMKQREDTIPSQDKPRLTKALQRLVKLYEAWGKKGEAIRWRKELEAAV